MRRPLLGLAVVIAAAAAATPAHADVVPEYFKLPAGINAGTGLDVAPNGTVYFGAGDGTELPPIGRLNPALVSPGTSNGITFVKTPDIAGCCAASIRDVSFSANLNQLYFTRGDGAVGLLKPGDVVTVQLTPGQIAPWGIAAAADGSAWMTEYGAGPGPSTPARLGSRIAHVSASLGLDELPNLAAQTGVFESIRFDAKPKGITVAADGTPWFTEADPGNAGYRIGRVDGDGYVEYSPPCISMSPCSGSFTGNGLEDVAEGRDGSIWYTDAQKKVIGRLTPDRSTIHEYALITLGAGLHLGRPIGISAAPDGSIWVANSGSSAPSSSAIIKLVPGAQATDVGVTVWRTGTSLHPLEVKPDGKGDVWFTGSSVGGAGSVGRLAGVTGSVPVDPGPGPGPGPGGNEAPPPGPPVTTVKPTTSGAAQITKPTVSGTSITANQICVGPPEDRCSLVYLIQTREYVKGFPGSKGRAAAKPKLTTIGQLKVTLKGGQSKKVTVKLNAKGKKLLKKVKKFKATFTVTQTVSGAKKPKTVLKRNVTFKQKK